MNEAVTWGMKLVNDIADYKGGKLKWSDVDHGCLLSGPPGVGKTLFGRALSETCAVPLIVGSFSLWHSSGGGHQGAFLKAMRGAFSAAKKQAPVILFIDEIDSFPHRAALRHDWADYEIQIVNALLAELDGTEGREGVVVIGACNLPEKLDPALVRSGRLDRHIRIELPDPAALEKILREHLGPDLLDADLATVAIAATGSSGADCERYVRGARRAARVAGRPMHLGNLIEEIGGHDQRSEPELLRAAIHEAGHAYAFATLLPGRLEAVSIRVVGSLGGTTASKNPNSPLTAADARLHMVTLLCGRAAEQVFYGDPSSGAGGAVHSDLGIATRWATAAAASLGFSKELGLVWRGDPDQANLSEMLASNPGLASVVQAELGAAYQEALLLIEGGRESVAGLAKALVQHRALSAEQVAAILASKACR
jgi:ATP-dependent Zn protease